jgi:hypothetical protein
VFDEVIEGPDDPPVKFATDEASLAHNAKLLNRFDFDLAELLDHFADTTLGYGSEFRPTEQLDRIFQGHPNFSFFRITLNFFKEDISEEQRVRELEANLERGNHKSATSRPEVTESQLHKDVQHGFSLPFSRNLVKRLRGALVQPCSLASQFSLTADGSRVEKERLTHDLSYERRLSQQQSRHVQVPGNDLRLVVASDHSLRCGS